MGWKQYFVYMMTNRWLNVLYTGVTNSPERHAWQHKHGLVRGFTKKYNCDRLVYYEIYDEILQAIAREKQIKNWPRAKKNALVETLNPEWKDIAADWYPDSVIPRREDGAESPPIRGSRAEARDDTAPDETAPKDSTKQ